MRENAERTTRITEEGDIMKFFTFTEYFDIENGETVKKEEVEKNYLIVKTIKNNAKVTADTTTIRRQVLVRRSKQLRIEFPSGEGTN